MCPASASHSSDGDSRSRLPNRLEGDLKPNLRIAISLRTIDGLPAEFPSTRRPVRTMIVIKKASRHWP